MTEHQLDIFSPISRRNDPVTSKIAERVTNATTRKNDQKFIYEWIGRNPDLTAMEICNRLVEEGFSYHRATTMHKRLSDLHTGGAILNAGDRKCSVTGHKAGTWRVVQ